MRSTTKKLLAISAAVSLGLAACGDEEVVTPPVSGEVATVQDTTTTTEAPVVLPAAAVDDPASTLRATLTSLLQEHAYLTGFALDSVLDAGAGDPTTQAALAALDENTVALGDAVGTIPGVDDTEAFVELWRDHIGYFVDYAVARSEGDQQGVDQALADLQGYQEAAAELFEQATDGELAAADVAAELQTHVESVTAVVDALAGEGEEGADPGQLLRDAAAHMEVVAETIADAVVAAHPDAFPGDPGSTPAEIRADLTAGLQEQVYLSVFVAQQLAETGAVTDPAVQRSITLLRNAGEDVANTVGGVTGTAERDAFLDAWELYVDALLDYAEARTTGGDDAATVARGALDSAGDIAANALSDLAAGADLSELIDRNIELITTSFDSIAGGDGIALSEARQAAQASGELGLELAAGIVLVNEQQAIDEGEGVDPDFDDGFGAAPDEAGEGTTGAGTVNGVAPGAGTDSAGPGLEEEEEPPSSPADVGGPSPDGER